MMTPVNRDNRAGKVLVNPARAHSFPLFLSIGALCENARSDFRNAGLWKHSGVHGPIEEDLSRLFHAAVKSDFRPAPALSFSLSLCAARTHMPQVMRAFHPLFRAWWYLYARII